MDLTPEFKYCAHQNDPVPAPPSSRYFTVNQFISNSSEFENNFSLMHFNIRSLSKNIEHMKSVIFSQKFPCSILGLSETWLRNEPHSCFSIDGYNMAVNNRRNRRGGGVALYVSTSLNYKVISELSYMTDAVEALCVEIIVPTRRNIVIAVVYRPPNSCHNDFITSLQTIISSNYLQDRSSFIMGDFNINILDENQNLFCNEFLDTLSTQSFMPLINKPTRITKTTASLIDNIFTNMHVQATSGVIISDNSDHFPIYTHLPIFQNTEARIHNGGLRKNLV